MHRETRDDDRKRAIGVGQGGDVAFAPADVGDGLFRRQRPGAVEHRRGHVDAGRVPDMRCEGANHDAAAAGHVEHRVGGARRRRVDDHL